jgi:hypothetical protein
MGYSVRVLYMCIVCNDLIKKIGRLITLNVSFLSIENTQNLLYQPFCTVQLIIVNMFLFLNLWSSFIFPSYSISAWQLISCLDSCAWWSLPGLSYCFEKVRTREFILSPSKYILNDASPAENPYIVSK